MAVGTKLVERIGMKYQINIEQKIEKNKKRICIFLSNSVIKPQKRLDKA